MGVLRDNPDNSNCPIDTSRHSAVGAMTDAGENLATRAGTFLRNNSIHSPEVNLAAVLEEFVRDELERAVGIAEKEKANIKDIDVAPEIQMVVNVACDQIATAIRKLKE